MNDENKKRAARQFEDLHIYQRARELTNSIYTSTRDNAFQKDYGLVDQVRRAAVSIMSNIAEGFERGTKTEFIHFLYIAKGSCGEVRAQVQIAADQKYLTKILFEQLYNQCKLISGMISNFIAHLQTSNYQGEKSERPKRLMPDNDKKRMKKFFSAQGIKLPNYEK